MASQLDKFIKDAGRLFASPGPTPETPIQPGPPPGDTIPTQLPNVRLLTPDGAYDIDPDKPAKRESDVPTLLADIRDLLETIAGDQKPEQTNFRTIAVPATVAANTANVHDAVGFKYLYIPAVPRVTGVWAGARQLFLGTLTVGQSMSANLPYTFHDVTLEYAAGAAGDTLYVSISNRDVEVTIH